jgi:hypothetical protein
MRYASTWRVLCTLGTAFCSACGDSSTAPEELPDLPVWRVSDVPLIAREDPVRGRSLRFTAGIVLFTSAGELVARDVTTGVERWRTNRGVRYVPFYMADSVVVMQQGGALDDLTAIDANTGRPLWTQREGSLPVSAAVQGALITVSRQNVLRFSIRDLGTGAQRWTDSLPLSTCGLRESCLLSEFVGTNLTGAVLIVERGRAFPVLLARVARSGGIDTVTITQDVATLLRRASWSGVSADGSVAWVADGAAITAVQVASGTRGWSLNAVQQAGVGATGFVTDVGLLGSDASVLTALVVGPTRIVALRMDVLTGRVISRQSLEQADGDEPMYFGRCGTDAFGYVTTSGKLRFADVTTGRVTTRRSTALADLARTGVLPAGTRDGYSIAKGTLLFSADARIFSGAPSASVGITCAAP